MEKKPVLRTHEESVAEYDFEAEDSSRDDIEATVIVDAEMGTDSDNLFGVGEDE